MALFEAHDSFSLPTDSVWALPEQCFYAYMSDPDGDDTEEIVYRPNLMSLTVLECTGDNSFELAYTIPHPESLADNYYGYICGDFDGDSRNEVVTIGSMGRAICFENVAPDSFILTWRVTVPHWNTDWIVGPADLDSDSSQEFYIMCASPGRNGFFIYGFENSGDNSFAQFWIDSLAGSILDGGSFALIDFDGDGGQELFVCSNPNIAIYQGSGEGSLRRVYFWRGADQEPYVADTDVDGFGEIFITQPVPAGLDVYEFAYGAAYRGDANEDCVINGLDVTYLVNHFKGLAEYPLPEDIYKVDVNGNCRVNGVDILYLVNYLKGGPPPIDRECGGVTSGDFQ
jgi:hypothetical protein